MTEPQLNVPVPFKVDSKDPWYRTGIFLRKDHVYRFDVPKEQVWHDGPIRDVHPDGVIRAHLLLLHLTLRMTFEKWFCLLGCVNSTKPYFKIGSHVPEYSPPEDGELTCFANDSLWRDGYYYEKNNEGWLEGTVTRIK